MISTRGASAWRIHWIGGIGIVLGFLLRLDQIETQILADDEWHSLHYLQHHGYLDIASHFGALADYCIPLTLLHRLLYETVGITELALRVVPLAAGIAILIALPLLLRPSIGDLAAGILTLLLAVFPLYVYVSRSVRPYSVALLLALVAVVALHSWLQDGTRRHAIAYVVCAALAPWFHLTVVPFVFAPLAWEVLRRLRGSALPTGPRLETLLAVGAAAAAAVLLPLGPPLLRDWGAIANKIGGAEFVRETWREASTLVSGTSHPLVIALWCALAGLGLAVLSRREPALVRVLVVAALFQVSAILVLQPPIAQAGIVFVRYVLPVTGVLVLGVAVALATWIERSHSRRGTRLRKLMCVVLVVAWVASGPLPEIHRRPNEWTNHGGLQFDYDMEKSYFATEIQPRSIPAFYQTLAAMEPGEVTIAEAPFHYEWHKNVFLYYQRVHRQHTIVADVNELTAHSSPAFRSDDRGARLRNQLPLVDLVRLRARGVRFVILHRDLRTEIRGWAYPDPTPDMAPVIRFFELRCGQPVASDQQLVAFDLQRCTATARRRATAVDPALEIR